ncbi:MAG: hypothetical protein BRD43_03815, partial [Bacteroidetes bacterium QS_4_64_154]
MEPIENRVAQGEIEVYNLADLWDDAPITELDISPFLVEGLMLKEKVFRDAVEEHDWSQHDGEHVALHCSTDAIVPTWGYMLIASELEGTARSTTIGRKEELLREYYTAALAEEDWSVYEDKPVVIKGCGDDV